MTRTNLVAVANNEVALFNSTVEAFNYWSEEHNEAWARYEVACSDSYDWDEEDDAEWERETREWLRNHSNNPADPNYSEIYSDVYKDLYGFRPR